LSASTVAHASGSYQIRLVLDFEHGGRFGAGFFFARVAEVMIRRGIVASAEIAADTAILAGTVTASVNDKVRTAAPGTTLVPFQITARGFGEPFAM
jgi:hypothetical protein